MVEIVGMVRDARGKSIRCDGLGATDGQLNAGEPFTAAARRWWRRPRGLILRRVPLSECATEALLSHVASAVGTPSLLIGGSPPPQLLLGNRCGGKAFAPAWA